MSYQLGNLELANGDKRHPKFQALDFRNANGPSRFEPSYRRGISGPGTGSSFELCLTCSRSSSSLTREMSWHRRSPFSLPSRELLAPESSEELTQPKSQGDGFRARSKKSWDTKSFNLLTQLNRAQIAWSFKPGPISGTASLLARVNWLLF